MLIGEEAPDGALALSARMRTAGAAFATGGDPGWAAYDSGSRLTQVFDTGPAVVPYPEEATRRI